MECCPAPPLWQQCYSSISLSSIRSGLFMLKEEEEEEKETPQHD